MIDIVVIGHGSYGTDTKKAVTFIAGPLDGFHCLDWSKDTSFDQFKNALEVLFCKAGNDILTFVDIADSALYKAAVQLAQDLRLSKNIDVIAGFNLGMVLQANASRAYVSNVHDLALLASDVGHKQIVNYDELGKE